MKDILFLPLDIPYLTIDYDKLVSVAQTLDTIADEYRNCEHIPIRWTKSVNNVYNKLEWTDITHNEFPEIIEYAEQHLKPFVGEIPRIMIITTPPNTEGFDHIDCSPKSFDDVQLKFRSVLHGKTSTLYFLNEQGEREYAPEIGQQPFLMDGGWPHGLDNFTNRCLHHYVYNPDLLMQICLFFNCEFIYTETIGLNIWFIMKNIT